MTQFIESTPGTIAAAMQQSGTNYSQMPMQQGFAEGGLASLPRGGYMGGGKTIGGGSFTGIPMGNRTGFGLLKKIKKKVKKLIPKELAGIMQVAAPFVAPHSLIGAGLMSGLGQYKSRGKISPLQLMMSMAPGVQGRHLSNIGLNKAGTIGPKENVLRNLMNRTNTGTKVDQWLFGKEAGMPKTWDVGKAGMPTSTTWSPATQGVLGKGGEYGGIKDIVSRGAEKIFMKGPATDRELDKTAVLSAALAGLSYWEAKEQIQLQNGIDLEEDLGITEDVWESTDWSQAFANDATYLQGNAKGGIPRTRYAMGTSQFPMTSTRGMYANGGMTWGSDQGEGLGGQEVEADMRYEGGFMPYGEEPKADDVPARLSKDEFVFTDEAVAGAGDGDVNVGAERLYKVMKSLEQGGRLSEESQGEGIGAMI
jgi:hypothetical protein